MPMKRAFRCRAWGCWGRAAPRESPASWRVAKTPTVREATRVVRGRICASIRRAHSAVLRRHPAPSLDVPTTPTAPRSQTIAASPTTSALARAAVAAAAARVPPALATARWSQCAAATVSPTPTRVRQWRRARGLRVMGSVRRCAAKVSKALAAHPLGCRFGCATRSVSRAHRPGSVSSLGQSVCRRELRIADPGRRRSPRGS